MIDKQFTPLVLYPGALPELIADDSEEEGAALLAQVGNYDDERDCSNYERDYVDSYCFNKRPDSNYLQY